MKAINYHISDVYTFGYIAYQKNMEIKNEMIYNIIIKMVGGKESENKT